MLSFSKHEVGCFSSLLTKAVRSATRSARAALFAGGSVLGYDTVLSILAAGSGGYCCCP